MIDYFIKLFDTTGFPARWSCGDWSQFGGYLHIGSDVMIALSYFLVCVIVLKQVVGDRDIIPKSDMMIAGCLAACFLLCGITHIADAGMFYFPAYRFLGLLKFITAATSVVTAGVLFTFFRKSIFKHIQALKNYNDFDQFYQNAPIGVGLVDLESNWIEVNEKSTQLLGYDREEIVGTKLSNYVFYEDIGIDDEKLELIKKGDIDTYTVYKRYIKKDGTKLPVRLTVIAIRNESGGLKYTAHQFEDIIDNNHFENSNPLLEMSLKYANVGTWILDLDTNELSWNQEMEEMFETEVDYYDNFLNLVHPDDKVRIENAVSDSIQNGVIYDEAYTIITSNGNHKYISARGMVIPDDKFPDSRKFIGVAIDLTESQLSQIELQQKNKDLNRFIQIASHDLKTPLRALANLSQWIVEEVEGLECKSDSLKKYASLITSRSARMQNLINGLLKYAKVGRDNLSKEDVNLNKILSDLIDVLNIGQHNVTKDNMPTIKANPVTIYQVFFHLIDNAIMHGNREKLDIRIKYEYQEELKMHQFSVIDNGVGIAEKYHKKIFDMFETLKSRDRRDTTGIGLTVVKKIIEEDYQGSISVESRENQGCKFIFTIRG